MYLLTFSIVLFFIGIIMFVLSYIAFKEYKENDIPVNNDIDNIRREKEEFKNKIEEADKILGDLNKFSTYVSSQMDEKHKELLFLYQLIDEKQEKLKNCETDLVNKTKEIEQKIESTTKQSDEREYLKPDLKKSVVKSPMTLREKIHALYENGKDIDEIAKELKKGKGEIRLMLDLEK